MWKARSAKFGFPTFSEVALYARHWYFAYASASTIPRAKGARAKHVLKIEYPVADYDSWKVAFDRDALDREGPSVLR
jgi:hypothetical protein